MRGPQPATGTSATSTGPRPLELGEEIGVAREVDGGRPAHQVAHRLGARAERAAPVVVGRRRRHLDRADADGLADPQLAHLGEALPAQERAEPARDDEPQRAAEPAERAEIEVVVVPVRDEHRLQVPFHAGDERHPTPQVRDALAEQRIGEQPRAVQVDQHRGVADVGELERHATATGSLVSVVQARRSE